MVDKESKLRLLLVVAFLFSLILIESARGAQQSRLSDLVWSHTLALSDDPSRRTLLFQEEENRILVYTGLELWELWMNGYVAKLADVPFQLRRLRAESFYYKRNGGQCFVVCRSEQSHESSGDYLFSFDISEGNVTELLSLPDIGLGDDYTTDYKFNQDYLRVAYWANRNTYFFRVNLESKKVRGFVSRFPAGLTYARVASSSDLFFGFDFRNKVVVLYDPVDDKLLWEHSGYINSPFLNQYGKTILIDQSGKGFLIDGRGQRSSAFEVKLGDNGINTALARDGKKACFLSENENDVRCRQWPNTMEKRKYNWL